MNSNVESYLSAVVRSNRRGLESGRLSMADALPCTICRELEVPANRWVESSDPFLMSYRALRRLQHFVRPNIPRKIEFGTAVYLKEGVIDCIFKNAPVTLIFVGDGNSDKRFAYNSHRLFTTFRQPFRTHSFICNAELIGTEFGQQSVAPGWDPILPFYHARNWQEIDAFKDLIAEEAKERKVLVLVDVDGTLFCHRPDYNRAIKDARKEAIVALCSQILDTRLFRPKFQRQHRKAKGELRDRITNRLQQGLRRRGSDDADCAWIVRRRDFSQ